MGLYLRIYLRIEHYLFCRLVTFVLNCSLLLILRGLLYNIFIFWEIIINCRIGYYHNLIILIVAWLVKPIILWYVYM